MSEQEQQAGAGPVERPVRPSLLTEKELLDIVDSLIRDRAFNRPAAVAIAMAVGAAVEAEVRERCAKLGEPVAWYDGSKFYGSQEAASMDCADMAALRPLYAANAGPNAELTGACSVQAMSTDAARRPVE